MPPSSLFHCRRTRRRRTGPPVKGSPPKALGRSGEGLTESSSAQAGPQAFFSPFCGPDKRDTNQRRGDGPLSPHCVPNGRRCIAFRIHCRPDDARCISFGIYCRVNRPKSVLHGRHSPVQWAYSPVQWAYSPVQWAYSPVQRAHSPVQRAHSLVQRAYSPA